MTLWKKESELDKEVAGFTVGSDYLLDQRLVRFDCIASIAHAKALNKLNILSQAELDRVTAALEEIISLEPRGEFQITQEDEDCHTAIENYLTGKLGAAGRKIHTARSRNDQVLTAMRLYEKDELNQIASLLDGFMSALSSARDRYGQIQIPGYTHMQKAMPTTVGTWLGCFIDSAKDDQRLLASVLELIDQSPLGTAAGFGVPVFDIDREQSAKLLGFSRVQENPLYAQMSRGKFEAAILSVLVQVMYGLNKLSTDILLFSMEEFGFYSLPPELCTGSSIMPQKKNPDLLELVRASYHVVLAEEFKIKGIMGSLISGYNRDLQLTKGPLFESIDSTKDCILMMSLVISRLSVNEPRCKAACTDELFATERAYELVKKGMPFRDAYKKISQEFIKKG